MLELGRDSTGLTTAGTWTPFGPVTGYEHTNTKNSNAILAAFTWDLAYRPESVLWEEETSGSDLFKIDYTIDNQGRVTGRDLTGAASGAECLGSTAQDPPTRVLLPNRAAKIASGPWGRLQAAE